MGGNADMGKACKRPSRPAGFNPETSCCEAAVLTTAPPCHPDQTNQVYLYLKRVNKVNLKYFKISISELIPPAL